MACPGGRFRRDDEGAISAGNIRVASDQTGARSRAARSAKILGRSVRARRDHELQISLSGARTYDSAYLVAGSLGGRVIGRWGGWENERRSCGRSVYVRLDGGTRGVRPRSRNAEGVASSDGVQGSLLHCEGVHGGGGDGSSCAACERGRVLWMAALYQGSAGDIVALFDRMAVGILHLRSLLYGGCLRLIVRLHILVYLDKKMSAETVNLPDRKSKRPPSPCVPDGGLV